MPRRAPKATGEPKNLPAGNAAPAAPAPLPYGDWMAAVHQWLPRMPRQPADEQFYDEELLISAGDIRVALIWQLLAMPNAELEKAVTCINRLHAKRDEW